MFKRYIISLEILQNVNYNNFTKCKTHIYIA